jgi:DNA excision repair protein ERCC-4
LTTRELKPEHITAVIDNREQLPFDLSIKSVRGTLATGDYSVVGLSHCIAIERKSLADLVGCVGKDRERFEKEIQRLLAYETRAIIVEASWNDLEAGLWRSGVSSKAAVGSVLSWIARGIPIILAGDRVRASRMCGHLLFLAARKRWRELQSFNDAVIVNGDRDET